MFGNGFNFFQAAFQNTPIFPHNDTRTNPNAVNDITSPPPVSAKLLNNLPKIVITSDDLIEESNKECLICLVEQELGSKAVKLPCGHIFHENCLKMWLVKHCTCPICRYELETDNAEYEKIRKEKMLTRKLRYRIDELQSMSIKSLKTLLKQFDLKYDHCIDKTELITLLINSRKIVIIEGVPPLIMKQHEFDGLSISKLKHMCLEYNIDCQHVLEKREFKQILLDSGRIEIPCETSSSSANMDANMDTNIDSNMEANMDANSSANMDANMDSNMEANMDANSSANMDANMDTNSSANMDTNIDSNLNENIGVSAGTDNAMELESGIVPESLSKCCEDANIGNDDTDGCINSSNNANINCSTPASNTSNDREIVQFPYSLFLEMSIRELKEFMSNYSISTVNCFEKADLIENIIQSDCILVMKDE